MKGPVASRVDDKKMDGFTYPWASEGLPSEMSNYLCCAWGTCNLSITPECICACSHLMQLGCVEGEGCCCLEDEPGM